ncbi:MAG TPA: molybdopterin molybdotransferase MoeA [Kiritimatiellia bacterium]|nr:molybdopterin molybdotransferase MoeA [Kiritimatiellia bacterium]HMP32802.1 molybdopterin molybdotransferase MoeA [Kiritimatiellia bacterium]
MTLPSVDQAYASILAHVPPCADETAPLDHAAGRILAEPVYADRDYPPIDRATMDGFAITFTAWQSGIRQWHLETTIPAGTPAPALHDPLHGCAAIMTGAEVPPGAGILPVEDATRSGATITAAPDARFTDRAFVHARASDRRAGDLLLSPGQRLDAPRIAILAATGHAQIRVARTPRVTILSTGSEIVPVETTTPAPGQNRASNAAGLAAALRLLGIEPVAVRHLPDNLDATREAIAHALAISDLILLTGGVSKGQFDHVPAALEQNQVTRLLHGIAQKPGKPLWFGTRGPASVFGLPGNPVSTLTVFRRYVVPYLQKLSGATVETPRTVTLATPVAPHPTLTLFTPVRLTDPATAEPVTYHGSGDLAALATSDGFVERPPAPAQPGPVPFRAW